MSADDMVFGEVAYREPQRLRRPDRDRRFACLAYEVPRPGDLPIFLDRKPADAIERHALRDTSVELGGILLGKECVDDETGQPFVWITESIEAKHYENTQASFTYTHDSWEEITRERDKQFPDLDIVGWYHTHPDFGIFLSGHDLFIHHNFFDQPLQVAYVVDPIRQTRGFFRWRDGQMEEVGGYYLTADRGERQALARLVNDLENVPNADGGGGGLSPRLEAELMAMLSRPQPTYAAAPTAQSAAAFSLLGAVLGALGLACWFWLQGMNQNLQATNLELARLTKTLETKDSADDLALGNERVKAKEAALDALLRSARVGGSTEDLTGMYTKVAMQRDEAQRKLGQKTVALELMEEKLASVRDQNLRLQADVQNERARYDKYADEVKKGEEDQLRRSKESQKKLAAMETTLEESKAGFLASKYQYAWYAAVVGWALSVLLGLGLILTAGRAPDAAAEQEPKGNGAEPPHKIQ